jgi:general secretion pathway protein D
MRAALFLLCLALAGAVHAQPAPRGLAADNAPDRLPVVIDLQGVSLAQVVHLVYKEISPASYVLAPDLVADQRAVSLRWSGMPRQLPGFLSTWLDTLGYSTADKAGTLFMSKATPAEPEKEIEEPKDTMIYWPRFQSAGALRELAAGVVAPDGFSSHRGLPAAPAAPQTGMSQGMGAMGASGRSGGSPAPVQAAPGSALSVMDRDDRMLIFRGTQKDRAKLTAFLDQVDRAAEVISVQGAIYEVATSKTEGSAFHLAANILRGKFGLTASLGTRPGGDAFGIKVGGLEAVMGALKTDTRFKVLSAPRLAVRSGGTARLVVGQEVPTAGAVSTNGQGGTLQSVEYRQSGIIFDLAPQVFRDAVRLTLSQQVSSFVRTDTGVNNSPTLLKREAKTDLDVFGDEVVVIGGLVDTKQSSGASGLPFLPGWMASKSEDSSGSELLVLLQVSRQAETQPAAGATR